MSEMTRNLTYWTPRALCMAFAAFLSLFALDVLGTPAGFGHKAAALWRNRATLRPSMK